MNAKEVAREIVPPVLWRALQALRAAHARAAGRAGRPEWEYLPEAWAYARAHPEVRGWDVTDILAIYRAKWPRFLELTEGTGPLGVAHESRLTERTDLTSHNAVMAFGYVLALASLTVKGKQPLSLLDWGGGIGHYYVLARALLPEMSIDYHCKDVRALAGEGARLFPEAHFYSDDACLAGRYDLVMASTSLHYAEDWKTALGGLATATEGYLYITGLPVAEHAASYVFIQRPHAYGYNTEYLGWCLNRGEFLECARSKDMSLVREFVVGLRPPVAAAPETPEYRGFLFRKGEEHELR